MTNVKGPFGGEVQTDYPYGYQEVVTFPNGWGASVINGSWSYGRWEVAILDRFGNLNYDTPLTCDVERFNTAEEAQAFVARVGQLTPEGTLPVAA